MNTKAIVNFIFLQALWFFAVLGAASGWIMPAVVWFAAFFCWYMGSGECRRQDLAIVVAAVLIGFSLDTLWLQLAWLYYSYQFPYPDLAPFWICLLWAGFGLTLNHSLRWLQSHLVLATVFSAVSAPLSYFAASRLGAIDIMQPLFLYTALSLSWAIVVPLLLAFAQNLNRSQIIGQAL